jgi:hypothetical protein
LQNTKREFRKSDSDDWRYGRSKSSGRFRINNRIKASRIFRSTLSSKLKKSIERIKSAGLGLCPRKFNFPGPGPKKLDPTISNGRFLLFLRKLKNTISKKFVNLFDCDFSIGKSCVLIWIGNEALINPSRLVDSSINTSSRIDERSMNKRKFYFQKLFFVLINHLKELFYLFHLN